MRDYDKYYNIIAKHIDVDSSKFETYKKLIDDILDERADEKARHMAIDVDMYKKYYRHYYQGQEIKNIEVMHRGH